MENPEHYVAFFLDEHRYCLRLDCVERVFQVVEWTPLPGAPAIVLGAIDIAGRVVPVLDIRKRFGLSNREPELSDRLIVSRSSRRTAALLVDSVIGVIDVPGEQIVKAEKIVPGTEYVAGVIRLPDGLVLIHDLDTFLSLDEEEALESAVSDQDKEPKA